ncbi:hypothetical protein Ddye_026347 [Dipteronia dyeriana]|uniref:Uncharacterized protein n=1 Tax=Dipteronia dyeriana TaxID=168575 RepID=A0AAD9WQB4_9ROSI|nr:hypothetical protein Ddye_026347 [Dipteronia dyeriana]
MSSLIFQHLQKQKILDSELVTSALMLKLDSQASRFGSLYREKTDSGTTFTLITRYLRLPILTLRQDDKNEIRNEKQKTVSRVLFKFIANHANDIMEMLMLLAFARIDKTLFILLLNVTRLK